ncbi:MAG: hypothetical protein HY720_20925, partial [Planctomycetes bacterium]|nr:hypothetical protein [Planctomycetota bacterium]
MAKKGAGRKGRRLPHAARFALAGVVPLGGGFAVTLWLGPHAAIASTWVLLAIVLFWPVLMLLVGVAGILLGVLSGVEGLADASGIVVE